MTETAALIIWGLYMFAQGIAIAVIIRKGR